MMPGKHVIIFEATEVVRPSETVPINFLILNEEETLPKRPLKIYTQRCPKTFEGYNQSTELQIAN